MTKKLSIITSISFASILVIGLQFFDSEENTNFQDNENVNTKEINSDNEKSFLALKNRAKVSSAQSVNVVKEGETKVVEPDLTFLESTELIEESNRPSKETLSDASLDVFIDENALPEDIVVPPVKLDIVNEEEREFLVQIEKDVQDNINRQVEDKRITQAQGLSAEEIIAEHEKEIQLAVPLIKVENVTQSLDFIPPPLESEL